MKTLEERLWAKIATGEPDVCWPFTGGKNKGYGQIKKLVNGVWVQYGAHRAAYECVYGELARGLEVDHTCNNPACCNPKHLQAVSRSENMKLIFKRGRGRFATGFGASNPRAKLTRQDVADILADPRSSRALAAVYGCDKATILRVRSGKTYRTDDVIAGRIKKR